jgi:tetratricopeptide (TPR) repeat protein
MLSSIREYARERLADADESEVTATNHARFYATFAHSLTPLVCDLEDAQWQRLLAAELDNLRAAIDWTIFQEHDPQVGLELLADLEWPELIVTPHEALRWYEASLAHERAMPNDLVYARLLRHGVILGWLTGRATAQREQLALRAIEVARRSGDRDEIARALGNLGAIYMIAGRFEETEQRFVEAYAAPERLSRLARNAVLRMWAVSNLQSGDLQDARRRFSEVARLERPGSEGHASALLNLGELEYAAGNVEAAREAARRAKASYASLNSVYTALVLSNLAAYAMEAGDLDEARTNLQETLELQQTAGDGSLAHLIQHHALLGVLLGDCDRALSLAGFSEALYTARGEARQYTERRGYQRLLQEFAAQRSPDEVASGMELGARLSKKEALACAAAIYVEHGRQ